MSNDITDADDKLRRHVSYLVHDIGPAIASFECVTHLLTDGTLDLGKESHRQLLENSKASIAYAKLLIENLLEFNYLSEEKILRSSVSIDWDNFLGEAMTLPAILAREKDVRISFEILQKRLNNFVNAGVLKRIIHNIIINSIKYCPSGSTVKIELNSESDQTVLTIQDNGPGLSNEKLEFIFEESFQLNLRTSGEFKGVGIGLAFCREAIRYLNGSLTVENILPHGLKFKILLPR